MEWIKCIDRLPELYAKGRSEVVLVVGKQKLILQNFMEDGKWALNMKVTHWQPLPELPEEYL